jgi:hypothetical protein
MGLDMFLWKDTFVSEYDGTRGRLTIHGLPHVDSKKVSTIREEIGYWRKANAIHNWFVENVQNGVDECEEAYVEKADLENLLKTVNIVLDDPSKASELLPPASGFFFGGIEIDEYYFDDLRATRKIIEEALATEEEYPSWIYQSSW